MSEEARFIFTKYNVNSNKDYMDYWIMLWTEKEETFIQQLLRAGYISLNKSTVSICLNPEGSTTKKITCLNDKWMFTYVYQIPTSSRPEFNFILTYKQNTADLPYLFTEDILNNYFVDWLNPTSEEITMFELEYCFKWLFDPTLEEL